MDNNITRVRPGDKISAFTKDQAKAFPQALKADLIYGRHTPAEGNFDCALVLGGPSEFMESRAAAAATLYHAGRVPYLMVSGGVCRESPFGHLSEAQILAHYLEDLGVPAKQILLENEATSTVTNMKLCKRLLAEQFPERFLKLVVVTSNFHIFRSLQLAKHLLPEHTIAGVGAVYPKDNPEEYLGDPDLCQLVANECICLAKHASAGIISDFTVL